MIVTRRRRKPFPWRAVLLPLAAIAVLTGALAWAPSRNWIASGPAAPLWRALSPLAAPFDLASQARTIQTQNGRIAALRKQIAQERDMVTSRDKQITALQTQVGTLQQQQALSPARRTAPAVPASAATAGPFGGAAMVGASGDLTAGATPDMRRTAADWAAMDPSAAAKILLKLPRSYDARILALMPSDAAGAILESLPPAFAAALTQEDPQLRR